MENVENKTIKSFLDLHVYTNLYKMIHHLSVCVAAYSQYVDTKLCEEAIEIYDISCKQLTNLGKSWKNFHKND